MEHIHRDLEPEPVVLRPPKTFEEIQSRLGRLNLDRIEQYVDLYNAGFAAGGRPRSARWATGNTPYAWDDGYLDRKAERPKWHTAHCTDHDNCPEG